MNCSKKDNLLVHTNSSTIWRLCRSRRNNLASVLSQWCRKNHMFAKITRCRYCSIASISRSNTAYTAYWRWENKNRNKKHSHIDVPFPSLLLLLSSLLSLFFLVICFPCLNCILSIRLLSSGTLMRVTGRMSSIVLCPFTPVLYILSAFLTS